jgi:predicted glycoside hydrolase/deacetylase ChbG (UPF0249 family)
MKIVINADDFGLSQGTNIAIKEGHQKGILTSASLFATTPALSEAIEIAKQNPGLGIGIHLSLTWGKSVLPANQIPLLVDKNGYFFPSYLRLIILSITNQNFLKQVENEFDAQINKLSQLGIGIDHINSQQHVHMIPSLFSIVQKLAQRHRVKYVRYSNENFFLVTNFPEIVIPFLNMNIVKFLLMKVFSLFIYLPARRRVNFIGLLYTTKTDKKVLHYILEHVDNKLSEVLLHPAYFQISKSDKKFFDYNKQKCLGFMKDPSRVVELTALTNPNLKSLISTRNIKLVSYRDLSKA